MMHLESDWAKGCCSAWLVGALLAAGLAWLWARDRAAGRGRYAG